MDVPPLSLHIHYRRSFGSSSREASHCLLRCRTCVSQPSFWANLRSLHEDYITMAGGYLVNPTDSANCKFCSIATTDDFLRMSFNIEYAHRWRNVGIVLAFVMFNIFWMYFSTYFFRMRTGSIFGFLKRRRSAKA